MYSVLFYYISIALPEKIGAVIKIVEAIVGSLNHFSASIECKVKHRSKAILASRVEHRTSSLRFNIKAKIGKCSSEH